MTSPEFEVDCAIYDEVEKRVDESVEDFKIEENACYKDPKLVCKKSDDKYAPTGSSQKGVVALAIVTVVLSLGLIAACIAFAVQIVALRSEINSQDAVLAGTNTASSIQIVSLQNILNALSNRLGNSSDVTSNEVAVLQQNLSIVFDWLETITEALGPKVSFYPVSSCAALPPSSPSGYYWVRTFNGSAVRVYCDMTRSCGGVTGGWMRVTHLDMTNSSQQCPSGFNQRTDSNISSCVKTTSGCASIMVPVILSYTRVCGRVIAYQKGAPDAFRNTGNIASAYVDGVSITHGSPRQHIWTLVAALDEVETDGLQLSCPCIRGNPVTNIPSFVGTDYFCDTGSHDRYQLDMFYSADPLWDGVGCGPLNTCCSFNTPPWFHRQLPQSTSDDIEIRVCTNDLVANEDIAIQNIDLYVH